ncbi:MAG: LapA family protein [Candidatus Zixiibacteriota bacterium]|nr:MAG: LapA family protein [candidate division Zixibacteria bacterium]
MWVIRWILITILLLALVGFMGQNQDELVDIRFFAWESPDIELAYALFIAFVAGVFVHLLFSVVRQFQLQAEIGRLKRQIRKLHEEVESLRNLAIEEDLYPPNITDTPGSGYPQPEDGSR